MPLIPQIGLDEMLGAFRAAIPGILIVIGVFAGLWALGRLTSCREPAAPRAARKTGRVVM